MSAPTIMTEEPTAFRGEVEDVLRRLRTTFAAIVSATPGNAAKAADLQRALKIDMKLSWKIFRVINAIDPLAEGHNVPGPSNMKAFFKAARTRGIPNDLIKAASDAAAQFEQFVARHASDREAFDSMVSDLAGAETSNQMHLRHKRAAFRANRHIWGVQAQTQVRCLMIQPASDPNMVSMAVIQGYQGLSRLRSQIPLVVSGLRIRNDDHSLRSIVYEPLAPDEPTSHGIALIPEFCSQPLPRFRTVAGEGGFVHGQLIGNGVGNTAAISCIHGHVIRTAFPRYCEENNRLLKLSIRVRIPCERLIQDVLVREDTFGRINPRAGLFGDHLGNAPVGDQNGADINSVLPETVTYLGTGPMVLHTPQIPRYPEMAQYAFDHLGWDGACFHAYRCEVEYPAMGGIVRTWLELPERPTT